jgi:hypothetical protein
VAKRYTAIVKIVEVEEKTVEPPFTTRSRYDTAPVKEPKATKETREVTDFTLRADTLAGLKEKLGGYISLI